MPLLPTRPARRRPRQAPNPAWDDRNGLRGLYPEERPVHRVSGRQYLQRPESGNPRLVLALMATRTPPSLCPRAPVRGQSPSGRLSAEQPTGSGNGFEWGYFGIGAAAMLGLMLLSGGLLAGAYFGRKIGVRPRPVL